MSGSREFEELSRALAEFDPNNKLWELHLNPDGKVDELGAENRAYAARILIAGLSVIHHRGFDPRPYATNLAWYFLGKDSPLACELKYVWQTGRLPDLPVAFGTPYETGIKAKWTSGLSDLGFPHIHRHMLGDLWPDYVLQMSSVTQEMLEQLGFVASGTPLVEVSNQERVEYFPLEPGQGRFRIRHSKEPWLSAEMDCYHDTEGELLPTEGFKFIYTGF